MSGLRVHATLVGAVGVASWASILIRWSDAPPLIIATWRLGLATALILPWTLATRWSTLKGLSRRRWGLAMASGCLLALHFWSWIASLDLTSVASSVVLVSTSPIFVGLGAHFLLRERINKTLAVSIAISVAGAVLIGMDDLGRGTHALQGDILALSGAVAVAGYLLIGRGLRPGLDLLSYVTVVYGTAAVMLLVLAAAGRHPMVGYPPKTHLLMVLLALGPQLVGHTTFNWALRYVSAAAVAVVTLGEPVGAMILAYIFLREGLTWTGALGSVLVLLAIYLAKGTEPGGNVPR